MKIRREWLTYKVNLQLALILHGNPARLWAQSGPGPGIDTLTACDRALGLPFQYFTHTAQQPYKFRSRMELYPHVTDAGNQTEALPRSHS